MKNHLASYPPINDRFDNLPAHLQEINTPVIAIAFGKLEVGPLWTTTFEWELVVPGSRSVLDLPLYPNCLDMDTTLYTPPPPTPLGVLL